MLCFFLRRVDLSCGVSVDTTWLTSRWPRHYEKVLFLINRRLTQQNFFSNALSCRLFRSINDFQKKEKENQQQRAEISWFLLIRRPTTINIKNPIHYMRLETNNKHSKVETCRFLASRYVVSQLFVSKHNCSVSGETLGGMQNHAKSYTRVILSPRSIQRFSACWLHAKHLPKNWISAFVYYFCCCCCCLVLMGSFMYSLNCFKRAFENCNLCRIEASANKFLSHLVVFRRSYVSPATARTFLHNFFPSIHSMEHRTNKLLAKAQYSFIRKHSF